MLEAFIPFNPFPLPKELCRGGGTGLQSQDESCLRRRRTGQMESTLDSLERQLAGQHGLAEKMVKWNQREPEPSPTQLRRQRCSVPRATLTPGQISNICSGRAGDLTMSGCDTSHPQSLRTEIGRHQKKMPRVCWVVHGPTIARLNC